MRHRRRMWLRLRFTAQTVAAGQLSGSRRRTSHSARTARSNTAAKRRGGKAAGPERDTGRPGAGTTATSFTDDGRDHHEEHGDKVSL